MTAVPSTESLVLLAVLTPFVGALIIPLFHKLPNLRESVTLVTAVALCATVICLLAPVLDGARPELTVVDVVPGLTVAFKVEPLGMLFALVASSLWIVNSIYSIGYMRANDEPRQTSFYVCFAVALGSTIGLAFAKNLFTLFLFYEALTLSTYPLVTHKRNEEAVRAGRIYLLLLLGTSLMLFLPAIIATWVFAGTLDFTPGGILAGKAGAPVIAVLLALYVFGIGKAAVMPLHFWLPAAMVAPTPVSALLHAVAVVKAGVFTVRQGRRLRLRHRNADDDRRQRLARLRRVGEPAHRILHRLVARQSEGAARLFDDQPARLCRARRGARDADRHHRQRPSDRHPCGRQDHAVLLRGRHLHRPPSDRSQRDDRHRPQDAGHDVGFSRRLAQHHRAAAVRRTWSKWMLTLGALDAGHVIAVGVLMLSSLLSVGYLLPIVARGFFLPPPGACRTRRRLSRKPRSPV